MDERFERRIQAVDRKLQEQKQTQAIQLAQTEAEESARRESLGKLLEEVEAAAELLAALLPPIVKWKRVKRVESRKDEYVRFDTSLRVNGRWIPDETWWVDDVGLQFELGPPRRSLLEWWDPPTRRGGRPLGFRVLPSRGDSPAGVKFNPEGTLRAPTREQFLSGRIYLGSGCDWQTDKYVPHLLDALAVLVLAGRRGQLPVR